MEQVVKINGLSVSVSWSQEELDTVFLPLLRHLVWMQKEKKDRLLVFLSAPPALGKSTLLHFFPLWAEEYLHCN